MATGDMRQVEQMVMNQLLAAGYPKDSIVVQSELSARTYVDFLVVDLKTNLPVLIVEVKCCGEHTKKHVEQRAFDELEKVYKKYEFPVKAVAAIVNRDANTLEFIDFSEAIKEKSYDRLIKPYKLPPYDVLTSGATRKAIRKVENEQKSNMIVLKVLCWGILPALCIGLILLDAFAIYTLSTVRLAVMGALGVILLLPCFREIKVGEITLKNMIEQQDDTKKK